MAATVTIILLQSTTWVKKVSERQLGQKPSKASDTFRSCFREDDSRSSYDGNCGFTAMNTLTATEISGINDKDSKKEPSSLENEL
jgi:hypothetical protein